MALNENAIVITGVTENEMVYTNDDNLGVPVVRQITSLEGLELCITDAIRRSGTGYILDWRFSDINGDGITDVVAKLNGVPLFTLALKQDATTGKYSYEFTMLSELPTTVLAADGGDIQAGGPAGSINVGLLESDCFVQITGTAKSGAVGAVNASDGFAGVGNGNLDKGESMCFQVFGPNGEVKDISNLTIQTKTGGQTAKYTYTLYKDGAVVGTGSATLASDADLVIDKGITFDKVVVKAEGNAVKLGVGGLRIETGVDMILDFEFSAKDGDGNLVDSDWLWIKVDGNGDGVVTDNFIDEHDPGVYWSDDNYSEAAWNSTPDPWDNHIAFPGPEYYFPDI